MSQSSVFNASSSELSKILEEMNQRGNFPIAVLTDRDGFPIASAAAEDQDPALQAAVVAMIQKVTAQARAQLGMSLTDEIVLHDKDGRSLVCRPFEVNEHSLVLAVVVPQKEQSYRRLTNQAVAAIQRKWRF